MKFEGQKTLKIAIMGGTFNPIHYGHLVTAEAVCHDFDIDELLVIPTGNPPHKTGISIVSTEDRYQMTVLGTQSNPLFTVSRIEIDREGKTYSIDTYHELKKIYPEGTEFYFIVGADAFLDVLTWKSAEDVLNSYHFIVAARPGYDRTAIGLDMIQKYGVQFVEVPALDISSTDIRNRVKEGRSIKYLLPEAVENYIFEHNLYRE